MPAKKAVRHAYKVISRELPKRPRNKYRGRYPFPSMKVGSCFYLEKKEHPASVRQCAVSYANLHDPGAKFSIRMTEDGTYACFKVA